MGHAMVLRYEYQSDGTRKMFIADQNTAPTEIPADVVASSKNGRDLTAKAMRLHLADFEDAANMEVRKVTFIKGKQGHVKWWKITGADSEADPGRPYVFPESF